MGCCCSNGSNSFDTTKQELPDNDPERNEEKTNNGDNTELVEEKIEITTPKKKKIEEIEEPMIPQEKEQIDDVTETFSGLYEIYSKHAVNEKLDIDGLTEALKVFGLSIDINKTIQNIVWKKFSLDDAEQIDYDDFSATISSLIDHTNEDGMFVIFQIFDVDNSLSLDIEELVNMLMAQHRMAAAVTGKADIITSETRTTLMNKATGFVKESGGKEEGQMSFKDFKQWRITHCPVFCTKTH